MNTHIASNIHFIDDSLTTNMKLLKISMVFSCLKRDAELILEQIELGQSINTTTDIINNMSSFGIRCNSMTFEEVERRKQLEIAMAIAQEKYEADTVLANAWFDNLSKEERLYVEILGHTKFKLIAFA